MACIFTLEIPSLFVACRLIPNALPTASEMLVFEPSTTISSRHVLTLAGTLILITKRNLQAEYIL